MPSSRMIHKISFLLTTMSARSEGGPDPQHPVGPSGALVDLRDEADQEPMADLSIPRHVDLMS